MAWHHHHQPLLVLMEDPIIHTDDHPFCSIDPTCSQHLPHPQEQQDTSPSAFPDLSTLSILWVPLHEVRQAWAAFGKEALTTSVLMATSTALSGLYWETHALQHSTWAADERARGRWHRVIFWLSRAVQDLDCALDQWQQALGWLDLAGNDHRQQDPESLEIVRTLMAQVQWHQGRRRALHQQVLIEYIAARQCKEQWEQQAGIQQEEG